MTTVATLDTVMRLNSTAFRQGMIEAAATANKSLGAIQKQASEAATVLLQLKRAAGAAGSLYLVQQGFKGLVDAQKQLQAIHYTFQAATGSASKAAGAFAFVSDEAEKLGLVIPDSADGFAKLSASATAAGVSMKDQMALFDAYAKASTTLHLSTTQSSRALLALEQMFAKGKIQAQELRLQLGQAVPGAAMRFQNAVMQMTKGTDLAGKSFDQLLEQGKLTTSKFLPALVDALQASGRGWEQASHGLQAELNRVQTAWFNLKTEVSGGLFGDAVTVGARTLASNLGAVANAITLIGAGTFARVTGSALSTGAGKAQRLAQEYRGTQMAAQAERAYAESVLATAKSEAEESAVAQQRAKNTLSGVRNAQLQAQAARDVARAEFEAAAATEAAAKANVDRLSRAMTLPANIRFQDAASAEAAAAKAALVTAEREYKAAAAAANVTREQSDVLNRRLIQSNIALAAAEDAVTAAEARVAAAREAEVAVGGLAAAAGRAAKSFGTFALSLVGGPWGAAVLAIGGVAYAIYSVQRASEEYRAETVEQAKSLQALAEQAKATAAEYGKLGSSLTLSQGVDALTGSTAELQAKRDELGKLREEAAQLKQEISSRGVNEGTAVLNWFDSRNLADLQDRIKQLEAEMPPAEIATGALSDALRARLTPAVDGLRAAIDAVRNGGSLGDFIRKLASPEDVDAGTAAVEHAQQLANGALSAMQSMGDKARKDLLTKGKSRVDQMNAELAVGIANIKAQHHAAAVEAEGIARLQKAYNANLPDARKADAADNAKKNASAVNQEANAYKNLVASQQGQVDTLRDQIDGMAGASSAQRLLNQMLAGGNAEFRKLTPAHRAEVLAAQEHIVALTTEAAKMQLVAAATKQLADLDRQIAEQRAQQDRENSRQLEGMSHGSQWNVQQSAIEQIQDAYRRQREEADKAYEADMSRAKAAGVLSAQQAILDDTHAQALGRITLAEQAAVVAQQQFFADQQANKSDWTVGAKSALEDYRDSALDVAGTVREGFGRMASDMEDALAGWEQTGKLSLKSFGQDFESMVEHMLAKALMAQAASALLNMFAPAATGSMYSMGGDTSYLSASYNTGSMGGGYSLAGGRASGGPVAGGNLYEVAERGKPELLTSGGRTYLMMGERGGHVTPAQAASGPGGSSPAMQSQKPPEITIINNNAGNNQVSAQSQQQPDGRWITRMVIDAVAQDIAQGGKTSKAMQGRYGLSRRGVPVAGA